MPSGHCVHGLQSRVNADCFASQLAHRHAIICRGQFLSVLLLVYGHCPYVVASSVCTARPAYRLTDRQMLDGCMLQVRRERPLEALSCLLQVAPATSLPSPQKGCRQRPQARFVPTSISCVSIPAVQILQHSFMLLLLLGLQSRSWLAALGKHCSSRPVPMLV